MTEPAPTSLRSYVRALGWASLVANILIVVTGGAVRLTGSGLGCPTWPRCTAESYVPHGSLGWHGAIEFGNRLLTFVLVAVAVATFVAAWRTGRRDLRRLAAVLALGIPAQAVVGGVTVLTNLNSWIVALHLLISMAMIAVAVAFVRAARLGPSGAGSFPDERARVVGGRGASALAPLGVATFVAGWVVLYLGTVVTGSGPHAGDADSPRNGLDPVQTSQLHADAVFLLLGLSLALVLTVRVVGATAEARLAASTLLVVELAQGVIGFVQYATDLPVVLVALHLLGAALVSAALTWTLLALLRPGGGPAPLTPAAAGTQPVRAPRRDPRPSASGSPRG